MDRELFYCSLQSSALFGVTGQKLRSLPATSKPASDGDDALLITPVQLARALASLSQDGERLDPQLISGIRQAGEWVAWEDPELSGLEVGNTQFLSAESASTALNLLEVDGAIATYAVEVEAGPDQTNGWIMGIAPPTNPRFVLVIVVEDIDSLEEIQEKGKSLLQEALGS